MAALESSSVHAALTDAQLRDYVRNSWELTSLTDDVISQYLDTSYEGIPFKDWIEGILTAKDVSAKLQAGDFAGAAERAAEFGADQAFDVPLEEAGLSGVSAVASLAVWPIEIALNEFVDAVKKKSFKDQCKLYFAARAHNSADRIRNATPSELLDADTSVGLVYKTDEGWLIVNTCYFFCSIRILGFDSPTRFYDYAELLWQAKVRSESLTGEDRAVAGEFLRAATPAAPRILTDPQVRTIVAGQTATFSVSVSSASPVTYQWRRNSVDIPNSDSASLNASDPGTYQVRVSNSSGSVDSRPATLTVLSAQTVEILSLSEGVTVSNRVAITANVRNATRVEFWVDGQKRASDNSSPFSWGWDTTADANGDHTIIAKAYSGTTLLGSTAARTVTVANTTIVDTCSDPTEPNERSTAATFLALGMSTNGYICTPIDVDWFRIALNDPQQLDISLAVPATKDFDLELYGPDALWKAGSYGTAGQNESIRFQATATGL